MELQSSIQVAAALDRMKEVFAHVKILLEGCTQAEERIQHQLDTLEIAYSYAQGEVSTFVPIQLLMLCSDALFDANSIEEVLRVEVVNRILLSTLQEFKEPFDGLVHSEELTRRADQLKEELVRYGYAGISLTEFGSLQVATTELMDSGKLALQNIILLKQSLVDDSIRFCFWRHLLRLASCFRHLEKYEESIPWFEAALTLAEFHSSIETAACMYMSNCSLGRSLFLAASVCKFSSKKEEMCRRAVIHLENSIHLFDDCPETTVGDKAFKVVEAHECLGTGYFDVVKDFDLSLYHLAKGAEIAAANLLHLEESIISWKYGEVLLEKNPEKIEECRASFRQSLEAALKINPHNDESLSAIHRATTFGRDLLMLQFQQHPRLEGLGNDVFLTGTEKLDRGYFSWIFVSDMMTDFPPSRAMACARAEFFLGLDYFVQEKLEEAIEVLHRGLRTLQVEPPTDGTGRSWSQQLSGIIHSLLGRVLYMTAKYEEAAEHFCSSAPLHDDVKEKVTNRLYLGNALFFCGDYVKAVEVMKELLSENLPDSDLPVGRADILAATGVIEFCGGFLEESILSLQESRKIYENKNLLEDETLASVAMILIQVHLARCEYWNAHHLLETFQPIMKQYHEGSTVWHQWQTLLVRYHQTVGDLRSANNVMEQLETPYLPVLDATNFRSIESTLSVASAAADVYRRENDLTSALEQYDKLEKLINVKDYVFGLPLEDITVASNKPGFLALACIYINRAAVLLYDFRNRSNLERACTESQEAVRILRNDYLRNEGDRNTLLATALSGQAVAGLHLLEYDHPDPQLQELTDEAIRLEHDHPGSQLEKLVDEAIQLVGNRDRRRLAKLKFSKANILQYYDPLTADVEGREAVLIFTELQVQLMDMESAWVTMFGLDMKHFFVFMQTHSLYKCRAPMKALLWAERGRMRLFVYLTRNSGNMEIVNANETLSSDFLTSPSRPAPLGTAVELGDAVRQKPLENFLGQASSLNLKAESSRGPELTGKGGDEGVHLSRATEWTKSIDGAHDNLQGVKKLSGLDELLFDKDDAVAEKNLFEAVTKCGPETVILEYTFVNYLELSRQQLLIYAVSVDSGDRHVVEWEDVSNVEIVMGAKRDGKKKWPWGKSLTRLIHTTRNFIDAKKENEAIEGLSLLHSLLIEPVQKYIVGCKRLILAVHEELTLVPFAALYNKQSKTFLVQEKIISYIPSINVLHYCFRRQQKFEQGMLKGLFGPPFVAGNPEPMGHRLDQLPGAADEAKLVAQILNVKPCLGRDMNKEVVKAGLSNASLVLLATHGVVDSSFPHGALILQGRDNSSSQKEETSSSTPPSDPDDNDVLVSDELSSLPGGIGAGLVVLSACRTAEGEVTSEGLLGLGRALLQGGAASVILTLWEVIDSRNKVLVAGMFEQLVNQGKDAAEALQHMMLQMLEEDQENGEKKYSICHWAPLIVVGSPVFKYIPDPSNSCKESEDYLTSSLDNLSIKSVKRRQGVFE